MPKDYFPILQRHLDSGSYQIVSCGAGAPSVESINEFASAVSARLPNDFIDFSASSMGGLYVAVKEELWPRPKAFDVGPFWSMLWGMWVFGFAEGIPSFMDIREQTQKFRASTGAQLVPCLKIAGDTDFYGFDQQGVVRRWNHELGEAPEVHKEFLEILDFELSELAKRKQQKVAESRK